MMKRNISLTMALLISLMLSAATVTKDEARQKALQFLSEKKGIAAASRGLKPVQLQLNDGATTDKLYVFNVGQKGGFVIVSGDDCTGDAILGYADSGEIPSTGMPDNLKAWLQGYADEISWMQAHGISNDATAKSRAMKATTPRTYVAPKLACMWDQGEPYDTYCPVYETGKHCPTGCAATATAQVLYYQGMLLNNKTTTTKADIPAYTTDNKKFNISAKVIRTFDWSKMSPTYPSTVEANEEVAQLMAYVGAALKMDYNNNLSSASTADAPNILVTYFGYDADIRAEYRNTYMYGEWIDLIYKELTTNGPVLYRGSATDGGHAFVLDGYDSEDYFHINWGWGGSSNGVFKLSVCYSEEQGTGGSSSKTGYNRGQMAVINVNPVDDGVTENKIRLTADADSYSKTVYNRTSTSENFSVEVGLGMFNQTGSTYSFNYGIALYGDEQNVLWSVTTDDSFLHNRGYNDTNLRSFSFGAGLADGEYRLVGVSRQHGTDTWLLNYDSHLYYIKATINRNTLTLEKMGVTKLTATLTTSGNTIGSPVTVTAHITNNGSDYSGDLLLIREKDSKVSALDQRQVEIAAGATRDINFYFTPSETGTYQLKLWNKNEKVIENASTSLEVVASSATTGTLSIDITNGITFENAVGNSYNSGIYGSKLNGTVTVSNTSETAHTSGLIIKLYKHKEGDNYTFLKGTSVATNISGNGSQNIPFSFNNLPVGTNFLIVFYYPTGNPIAKTYAFPTIYGITTYAADGTESTVAPAASVTVADNVLAVDFSNISDVTSVTPNSNPNTLYILGSNTPTGLGGKNVVANGVATTLTLSDGYGFYSPLDFTATTATYTRQFTTGASGSNGWSTIVLPFAVNSVKQGEKTIDWFRSGTDTGKHFWVKSFSSEDGSTVYFDFASVMAANTPYIIAVPGNTWGEEWNLTNKDITFQGNNVTIGATKAASVSGNKFKFTGTFASENVTDCYVLNNEGNSFTKSTTAVAPFRSYFKSVKMIAGDMMKLSIGSEDNKPTAITTVQQEKTADEKAIYLLDGRRVKSLQKGINIVGGKKIIIK